MSANQNASAFLMTCSIRTLKLLQELWYEASRFDSVIALNVVSKLRDVIQYTAAFRF